MGLTRLDRWAVGIIILGLMVRLSLAHVLPLGNDETYAVAVSREFSISFFDHPPIPFWLSGLGAMVFGEHSLGYRLPFVIFGTGTAFVIWRLGRAIGGDRVGLWSVTLWHLTPHLFAASGIFALPEGPMNFFCLATLLTLSFDLTEDRKSPRFWVWALAGGFLGLAFASKYNAGIFAIAVFGFLLVSPKYRRWLGYWQPWAGALIALTGVLPTIIFGIQTDWASFRFHSGRTGGRFDLENLLLMYTEQVQLLGYFNAVILGIGLVAALRSRQAMVQLIFAAAAVGMLFFVPIYAYGTYTHPHWTMPGWLMTAPLAALWLNTPKVRRFWIWAFSIWAAIFWMWSAIGFFEMTTGTLTRMTGEISPIFKNTEVRDLSKFSVWLKERGWLDDVEVIGVDNWETGGKVSTALQGKYGIKSLGRDGRHFQFHKANAEQHPPIVIVIGRSLDRDILDREAKVVLMGRDVRINRTEYFVVEFGGLPLGKIGVYGLDWQ